MSKETEIGPFDRLLRFFKYSHLPKHLQDVSKDFSELAHQMAFRCIKDDGDIGETMAGIRKLLESKDCAVRAAIK